MNRAEIRRIDRPERFVVGGANLARSISSETLLRSAPCLAISGVWNIERVNMKVQWKDALLLLSRRTSTGFEFSTMLTIWPSGLITPAMVVQY